MSNITLTREEFLDLPDHISKDNLKIGALMLPDRLREAFFKNETNITSCFRVSELDLSIIDFPKITYELQRINIEG